MFWYNLRKSGAGDSSTRHAACPVIVGSKWGTVPIHFLVFPYFSLNNRAYAGLCHATVITTKPCFVVKRTCNTEVRLGGDIVAITIA